MSENTDADRGHSPQNAPQDPDPEAERAGAPRGRDLRLPLLAGAALLLILAVVLAINGLRDPDPASEETTDAASVAGASPDGSDAPEESGEPPEPPTDVTGAYTPGQTPPAASDEEPEAAADRLIAEVVSYPEAVLDGSQEPDTAWFEQIATGTVLGELEATATEFGVNGWRQEGVAIVVSIDVVATDLQADPPSFEVEVCLDSSEVRILDADGNSLIDPEAARRSVNVYGIENSDGVWRLARHNFAEDPDC